VRGDADKMVAYFGDDGIDLSKIIPVARIELIALLRCTMLRSYLSSHCVVHTASTLGLAVSHGELASLHLAHQLRQLRHRWPRSVWARPQLLWSDDCPSLTIRFN